jgi:hypothetical protein
MFHLVPNADGSYTINIRKDRKYVSDGKYVTGKCCFSYMDNEIRDIVTNGGRPISYRIKVRGTKVYLQAIFTLDKTRIPIITRSSAWMFC